jgi:hypothetical protein
MKHAMHILLTLVGLMSSTTLLAQVKVTTEIISDASADKQLIQAKATGGSGKYSFAWGLTIPGAVPPNNASEVLLVPAQEAEYIVFVRDKETGASAYSTVIVKAPIMSEEHLLRMPGKDYKMNLRYSAIGALPVSPTGK